MKLTVIAWLYSILKLTKRSNSLPRRVAGEVSSAEKDARFSSRNFHGEVTR